MASSQLLNDAAIDRQIALVRYSNGRAQTVLPYMREIVDYLEGRLAKEGETIATQKALNALLADVKKKMNTIYTDWETADFNPILDRDWETTISRM